MCTHLLITFRRWSPRQQQYELLTDFIWNRNEVKPLFIFSKKCAIHNTIHEDELSLVKKNVRLADNTTLLRLAVFVVTRCSDKS